MLMQTWHLKMCMLFQPTIAFYLTNLKCVHYITKRLLTAKRLLGNMHLSACRYTLRDEPADFADTTLLKAHCKHVKLL